MTTFTSKLEMKTRELLADRPRTLSYAVISQTALEMGGDLPVSWITSFMTTPNSGFSVARVELLYIILTGKELEL